MYTTVQKFGVHLIEFPINAVNNPEKKYQPYINK